ncbi:hypothetical protein [Streptomyces sp. NPDC004783]|uniref:hypothetical protein n=1 Tax=Streptomyces sp. NPDC004783 TaxID=3154459 RepID=UPI0033A4AC07
MRGTAVQGDPVRTVPGPLDIPTEGCDPGAFARESVLLHGSARPQPRHAATPFSAPAAPRSGRAVDESEAFLRLGHLQHDSLPDAACSTDLAALRAFAARHAAAHAKAATVRPNARCHCGSQRCGAHPDTQTHCAGAVLMILRHDPVMRRVWSVEEVCET